MIRDRFAIPLLVALGASWPASADQAAGNAVLHPINPPGPAIPGISQGMLIAGGQLLVLWGHVPFDAQGRVPEGLPAQLEQVLRNLDATLRAAGSDFQSVARLTIYVRDYAATQLAEIRGIRDRWVSGVHPPASALIGVASLFTPMCWSKSMRSQS